MNRTALWLADRARFGGYFELRQSADLAEPSGQKKAKKEPPAPEQKGIDRGSFYAAGIWLLTGLARLLRVRHELCRS